MGFDAIWISPVVTNAPPCYHGYCALDYYTINDHFGGKDDLVNLIEAMHKRNMWLMLDVVANHSIPMNTDIREAGQVNPFNK